MGFVLGPILGLVTNHTARILFEVSSTGEYIFRYMKEDDREYTIFKYHIKSGTPSVIHLKNLISDKTYYYEVVDLVKGKTLEGKFRTLNQTFCMISPAAPASLSSSSSSFSSVEEIELSTILSSERGETKDLLEIKASSLLSSLDNEYQLEPKDEQSISFISCHNYSFPSSSSKDKDKDKDKEKEGLWKNVQKNNAFYSFHLGDQVYTNHCKKRLKEFLKDIPSSKVEEQLEEIKEHFREVYKRTWNNPEVKECLKTKSNLMMGSDKSFSLGGKYDNNLIKHCSYEVYKEYQRSLRVNPRDVKNCDYFLLQIGSIGYVVIDSYCRNFRRKKRKEYLGKEQIQFFKENMPRLSVSRWVVISTQPIFQTSSFIKSFYNKISFTVNKKNTEITDGFTKKGYAKELKEFLSLFLKENKQRIPLFISGDTHVGVLISIKHNNKVEGYQLITGGIQNRMSKKKYAGYRLFVFVSGKTSKIAGFTHKLEWNRRACNYVKMDFLGEGAKIEYVFVKGRGKGLETFFYTV